MTFNDITLQNLQISGSTGGGKSDQFDNQSQNEPFITGRVFDVDSDDRNSVYDDASSTISRASTIEYNQECFASFQRKVVQLILDLFPGHRASDIHVERMKGGAFNRIIGITLCSLKPTRSVIQKLRSAICGPARRKSKTGKLKHYILRIPRDPSQPLLHQVKIIQYMENKLQYATPKLVRFDAANENALGRPYMLQERLPGQPLTQLWEGLNQTQRESATKSISEVITDLQKLTNKTPGILSSRNTSCDLQKNLIRIEPHLIPASSINYNPPLAQAQTTRGLLLDLCKRQRAHTHASGLKSCDHIFDGFTSTIEDMFASGLIPDSDTFYFYHADLYSRNLLFTIKSPTSVTLTGILDWDSASFAPKFMSTRAPFFLWSGDDADENEEGDALVQPEDRCMTRLKQVFESTVSDDFVTESYKGENVLARRIWYFLVNGLRTGGDVFLAEEMLDEWKELSLVNR